MPYLSVNFGRSPISNRDQTAGTPQATPPTTYRLPPTAIASRARARACRTAASAREPVTESIARHAAALLAGTGPHGHKYAIDAMLGATALASPGPVTALTSDPEDLTALRGSRITAIKV